MDNAALVEESNGGQKIMKPIFRLDFRNLYGYEVGQVVHSDECIGWCDDKRMKHDDRRMWVVLECSYNFHLVPAGEFESECLFA